MFEQNNVNEAAVALGGRGRGRGAVLHQQRGPRRGGNHRQFGRRGQGTSGRRNDVRQLLQQQPNKFFRTRQFPIPDGRSCSSKLEFLRGRPWWTWWSGSWNTWSCTWPRSGQSRATRRSRWTRCSWRSGWTRWPWSRSKLKNINCMKIIKIIKIKTIFDPQQEAVEQKLHHFKGKTVDMSFGLQPKADAYQIFVHQLFDDHVTAKYWQLVMRQLHEGVQRPSLAKSSQRHLAQTHSTSICIPIG
ncbi:unnamed protein product [Trichogramma brassicae]|uniref:Uncharacterized protein n=1 Tax=Trichogramma brassicae TaxID=86971 RepID=A0A6H5I462_9HYME|nr:unnamed protein product [Trichogramma brassicae]